MSELIPENLGDSLSENYIRYGFKIELETSNLLRKVRLHIWFRKLTKHISII